MGSIPSRAFDPLKDVVDLRGKVAIVTGGNTGIGFATVQHLARAGAKVYLAARNEARATDALTKLKAQVLEPGNGEVKWLKLDLSDAREVKMVADEFIKTENRLDILINNAAIVTAPYEKTPDGVPTMVAVNYLGPYVFTRTLLPLLKQTAQEPDSDVRIVNVASTAYSLTPSWVKFSALQDFNQEFRCRPLSGLTRYAHSKLMVIMWTRTLQKQLDADSSAPITALAIHPGGVDTFTHKWPMSRLWKPIVGLFIAQPETGAYTSVFAAASKKVAANRQLYKGAYLESKPPGHFKELNRMAKNDKLAKDLAKTTDSFLKDIGV